MRHLASMSYARFTDCILPFLFLLSGRRTKYSPCSTAIFRLLFGIMLYIYPLWDPAVMSVDEVCARHAILSLGSWRFSIIQGRHQQMRHYIPVAFSNTYTYRAWFWSSLWLQKHLFHVSQSADKIKLLKIYLLTCIILLSTILFTWRRYSELPQMCCQRMSHCACWDLRFILFYLSNISESYKRQEQYYDSNNVR